MRGQQGAVGDAHGSFPPYFSRVERLGFHKAFLFLLHII